MLRSLLKRWRRPTADDDIRRRLREAEGSGRAAAAARRHLAEMLERGATAEFEPAHVALYHPRAARRVAAVADIDDEAQLRRLINHSQCKQTKLAAIERSRDDDALKDDLRRLRDSDKKIARALQQRIHQLRDEARSERGARRHAEKLVADFEDLARQPWDKYYEHRLLHLQRQRQSLGEMGDEARKRLDQAEAQCRSRLEDHQQRLESPERQRDGVRELEQAARRLRRQAEAMSVEELRDLLDRQRRAWEESTRLAPADESLARRHVKCLKILSAHLSALRRWRPHREEWTRLNDEKDGDDIDRMREKLNRLRQLAEEIAWPEDLVAPKALAPWPATARDLGRRIERGERAREKQRLRDANPTAAERESRSRKRDAERLKEALKALEKAVADLDAETPDWKPIDALKRKIVPLRKALPSNPATDKRYRAALERLNQTLEPLHKQHAERKRVLINMARKLGDVDDAKRAASQAQQLRKSWQELSAGPAEGTLLKEFNSALDEVFADRRDLSKRRRQKRDFDRKTIQSGIDAIDALRKLDDEELVAAQPRYRQLREETFEQLQSMAKKDAESLRSRLLKACERFEAHFDSLAQRRSRRDMEQARQCAALCRELEQAETDDARKAADAALNEKWRPPEDAKLSQRLEARRQAAARQDFKGDERGRRLLAIRLEWLAELDSPPEEQELRRDDQMEQLQQGLGGGGDDDASKRRRARDLELEWLCGPAAAPALERRLAPRIERALARLGERERASAIRKDDAPKPRRGSAKKPKNPRRAPRRSPR